MALSAVSTTGIYCRAGCVARPHARNVTMYMTGVAAEADGYRACLRCRPDRSPGSLTNLTVPEPLGHALILITDGFLDSANEDALAARVGYSARQLRRLFTEFVGATPSAIAHSRRAHFARRLIDDTDLDFGSLAKAAGFTGPRQLHRAMTGVFRFSPSELRAKRARGERPRLDGGLQLLIPYVAPYDFGQMLRHLGPRCIPGVEVVEGDTYRRSIEACGHPGVAEVADAADGEHLRLTLHLPTFDAIIDEVTHCRNLFGVDSDPSGATEALEQDPVIGGLAMTHASLRVPGCWDRFESAVRMVVGQQISVAGATTIAGRIVERAGAPLESGVVGITHCFPTPAQIINADLSGLGLIGRRIETITCIAHGVRDGTLDLHAAGPIDAIAHELCQLPGVGPWTAHMIAMRAMGHPDAMPASDLGLRRGMERLTGEPVSGDELETRAEAWRPHRSRAAQLLWMAADAPSPALTKE